MKRTRTSKIADVNKLCKCGCGKEVSKKTNRFIVGHHVKLNNPMLGKKHSEEARRKMSEFRQEYYEKNPGPNLGIKFSIETRKRISDAKKGSSLSEEIKRKISITMQGNDNARKSK